MTSSPDYRAARSMIGLVPQELHTDAFESVWDTVSFSRGLFGKPKNPAHIEKVLKDLSLWDKKDAKIITLSGGMKRRVMIAKALSHEPKILFLDEPTAGVDVELRKGMWEVVRTLQASGVTIILTTHYIDEAEEMADRDRRHQQGRDHPGRGQGQADAEARRQTPDARICRTRSTRSRRRWRAYNLMLCRGWTPDRSMITTPRASAPASPACLSDLRNAGIRISDLDTKQSSLEDIFVSLVKAS